MKRLLVLLFIVFTGFTITVGQSKQAKAKVLIRNKFKETMNDYKSYEPVSYSKVDSLFYNPLDDDEFVNKHIVPLVEAKEKVGLPSLTITTDVSSSIKKVEDALKEEPNNSKLLDLHINLLDFSVCQGIFQMALEGTPRDFIGWKISHKFRGKNVYNATILNEYEFHFNKDMTKIVEYKSMEK